MRPLPVNNPSASLTFQSTHPSGVRRCLLLLNGLRASISIHAPQWGATFQQRRLCVHVEFQSTHPSGVRPWPVPHVVPTTIFQSTHPSGVRLALETFEAHGVQISIHAPQWGATRHVTSIVPSGHISIHAPQWGATSDRPEGHRAIPYFNPRTPVGCDGKPGKSRKAPKIFQSTHPSGVRL